VALAALACRRRRAKVTVPRMLLLVAGLIFAINVYLGGYHAGGGDGAGGPASDCGRPATPPRRPPTSSPSFETIRSSPAPGAVADLFFLSRG
jgi:hypothetical protein